MVKATRYDVAEHLRTPEEAELYLRACAEESGGDTSFMDKAHGDVARAEHSTTTHITPAGGNVFLDLGFEPEEAARLLADSDRKIAEKLSKKVLGASDEVKGDK